MKVGESTIISKYQNCIDSCHAEEHAIKYINKFHFKNKNKIKIIIWKKSGSAYCCERCKIIIKKTNFNPKNIVTPIFKNGEIKFESAIRNIYNPLIKFH